jgi:hypothetical protein
VSFAAVTLCVASQKVIPKVSVYFVIESVRKLLDTPSYLTESDGTYVSFRAVRREIPNISAYNQTPAIKFVASHFIE